MADTEKITINMSVVDLGQVDLLVDQGFYSSRTDFIRTAIRNLLMTHSDAVRETVTRKAMVVGVYHVDRATLESLRDQGEQLEVRVVGTAVIADDVTPELVRSTISSINVLGVLRASPAIKAALADRIRSVS